MANMKIIAEFGYSVTITSAAAINVYLDISMVQYSMTAGGISGRYVCPLTAACGWECGWLRTGYNEACVGFDSQG